MNKTLITVGIGVLFLVGIMWIARPNGANDPYQASAGGAFVVEESNMYDFGTISMKAGDVAHRFTITNKGAEAVTLGKMYTSCMCTTATLEKSGKTFGPFGMPGHGLISKINETMNPGEEASVEVIFDPAAHGPAGVGRIERQIFVETSSGTPFELRFAAVVTP